MIKKTLAILIIVFSICTSLFAQQDYKNPKFSVGQKFPNCSGVNPQGDSIIFTKINKGNYVLVDFWASWCRPCRMSNPSLVAGYNELKKHKFGKNKNGFEVLSISLDKNKNSWEKAISDDQLSWKNHISDLGGWKSAYAALYAIQVIPQVFLIDPNGVIIGNYLEADKAISHMKTLIKK